MSLFKFLTKKSTVICLAVLVLIMAFVPVDAFAQGAVVEAPSATDTGPFDAFLDRAATLFMQTRNALFVVAAFAFIQFAWTAINKGEIDATKIFYLVVGLVILGVAGWMVAYLADPTDPNAIMDQYKGIGNSAGWDQTN